MRFLCFHGRGTNAKIFEAQTAAIRYELGDGHEYEFVNGTTRAQLAPELKGSILNTNTANNEDGITDFTPLSYCNETDPVSVLAALEQLSSYLEAEGPFDGVIAFSMGAAFVTTWILDQLANTQAHATSLPFKCIVLFSSSIPGNATAMREGRLEDIAVTVDAAETATPAITIPTAHIWGANDDLAKDMPSKVFNLCDPAARSVFVHGGGHEVPSASERDVTLAVNVIRRCISLAQEADT
ncbi:serine hydrolase FSH [Rhypophila decipiens]|uniref:Serine hydrolase FSH n=1 Tax=Rhypophila decipiens TaxID=261697 RepID=A0AAN6XYD9_9PEZI|nr:serine hydrolase FSH [Rhypophila decipiens]